MLLSPKARILCISALWASSERQKASYRRSTFPPIRISGKLQELPLQYLLRYVGRELKLELMSEGQTGSAEIISAFSTACR